MAAILIRHGREDNELAKSVLSRLVELSHHSTFLDLDAYCGIPAGEKCASD